MKGLNHTYTCIHSLPKSPPIQAATQHREEFPMYTVGPCWLSILNIEACMCQSQIPSISLPPFLPHKFKVTISLFSKSVSLKANYISIRKIERK